MSGEYTSPTTVRARTWGMSVVRLVAVAAIFLGSLKLFAPFLAYELPVLVEFVEALPFPTPEWYLLLIPGLLLLWLTVR
jgi:hypothetical protein